MAQGYRSLAPYSRTRTVLVALTAWLGLFAALWLLWSALLDDRTVGLIMTLIAVATISPLLAVLSSPDVERRR